MDPGTQRRRDADETMNNQYIWFGKNRTSFIDYSAGELVLHGDGSLPGQPACCWINPAVLAHLLVSIQGVVKLLCRSHMDASCYFVSLPLSDESPTDSPWDGHDNLLAPSDTGWRPYNHGIWAQRHWLSNQRIHPNAPIAQNCDNKKISYLTSRQLKCKKGGRKGGKGPVEQRSCPRWKLIT